MMTRRLKRMFLAASLMCLSMIPTGTAAEAADTYFYAGGQAMDASRAAQYLSGYDVVMFGEYHDQHSIHVAENEFFRAMHEIAPQLALSMEMLERDGANDFDRYLRGELTEDEMKQRVRLWDNWDSDYRPMAEYARLNGLDVISSNIPRYLAAYYAKNGTLEGVKPADRPFLPIQHVIIKNGYYERFKETMSAPGKPMKITGETLDRYYGAQCLKDDTMAESIALYLDKHPAVKVIHYQGSFHGNYHLGAAEKLARLRPELKIAVIAPAESVAETEGRNEELYIIFARE